METLLQLKNLSLTTKWLTLNNINLEIYREEFTVIAGKRDSGIFQLSRIIFGLYESYKGEIILSGKKIKRMSARKAIRHGILGIFPESGMVDNLNIIQNFNFNKKRSIIVPSEKKTRSVVIDILKHLHLSFNIDTKISNFSRIDKLYLELGRVFYYSPKILIFTFPTDNITTDEGEKIFFLLSLIREKGIPIVYFTNELDDTLVNFSSRIYIFEDNKFIDTQKESTNFAIKTENFIKSYYSALVSRKNLDEYNDKLLSNNIFLQNILDNINIPLLVFNKNLSIIFANRMFINNSKIREEKLIGSQFDTLFPNRFKKVDFNKLLNSGNFFIEEKNLESEVLHRTVKYIEFISLSEMYMQYAKIETDVLVLIHYSDFTMRKEDNSTKNDFFIQKLQHEISNSSNIVLNFVKLLKNENSAGHNNTSYLQKIEDEIQRRQKEIQNFVDLYMNSNPQSYSFNISSLMDTLKNRIQPHIEGSNIDINITLPEKRNYSLNYMLILQVLYNLTINSIDAIESSGKIDIACSSSNSTLSIVVTDTGIGIAKENMSKIFDSFYSTKSDKSKNRGLGLSIVQDIIKKLSGTIYIASEIDKGTCVTVHIPYSDSTIA